MKKTVLKVIAILSGVESLGFFALGYQGVGYIFAVIAIVAALELTNVIIKEEKRDENSSK